jgi:DNA polymerase III epsilon subunit-like protein
MTTHDKMNAYDLKQYEALSALLAAEEALPPVAHYDDWQARKQSRAVIGERLWQLGKALASLQRRAAALPTLAEQEPIQWAQALLAFPNLAFLEVDTDGLDADADILRIVLVDQTGTVLYDQLVQPRRPLSPKIAHLTGITPDMLAQAPTLADIWRSSEFLSAFVGRYLLSFNLEFDRSKLAESAARYSLPLLPFVGECLMQRAQEYYVTSHYPKLAQLCDHLGSPLPPHPQQDALDRARGQVHLLRTMAQGITDAQPAHQIPDEAKPPESGDPFLPDFPDEGD